MSRHVVKFAIAGGGCLLVALLLYLRGGIVVTIQNKESTGLIAATVHVTGRSYRIGDIAPQQTKSVRVFPQRDSHIEIEHGSATRQRVIVDTYLNKGDRGTLKVEIVAGKAIIISNHVEIGWFF